MLGGFGCFNTNHDGVLNGSDQFVKLAQVTADGVSKLPTLLDVDAADLAANVFRFHHDISSDPGTNVAQNFINE